MTGFLLDTNVISMLSPSRAAATAGFLAWLDLRDREESLFLSVVTVHEIEKGIALLEHKGATAKAASLRAWLDGLLSMYGEKVLPFTSEVAVFAGRLEAMAVAAGHAPGMADAMIAGTARAHALQIVTCNRKHFEAFGVAVATPEELAALTARG